MMNCSINSLNPLNSVSVSVFFSLAKHKQSKAKQELAKLELHQSINLTIVITDFKKGGHLNIKARNN